MTEEIDIQTLIEETTTVLGATNQTYVEMLKMFQQKKQLIVSNRLLQGQLVFFRYNPLTIPTTSNKYYDSFPLVLITETFKGGFEGINFHYIHPTFRGFLFDLILQSIPTLKNAQEWKSRLALEYKKLKSNRKLKFFKPCYKRYLWKGMQKRPVMIPFDLWKELSEAEIGTFVGARRTTVYRDSYHKAIKKGT